MNILVVLVLYRGVLVVVVVVGNELSLRPSRILLVDPKRTLLRTTIVPTIVTVGRTCVHGRRIVAACRHGPRINGTITVSIPVGISAHEVRHRSLLGRIRGSCSTCSPCRHGLASTTATSDGGVIPSRSDAVPNRRSRRGPGHGHGLARSIIGCVVIVAIVTVAGRRRGRGRDG